MPGDAVQLKLLELIELEPQPPRALRDRPGLSARQVRRLQSLEQLGLVLATGTTRDRLYCKWAEFQRLEAAVAMKAGHPGAVEAAVMGEDASSTDGEAAGGASSLSASTGPTGGAGQALVSRLLSSPCGCHCQRQPGERQAEKSPPHHSTWALLKHRQEPFSVGALRETARVPPRTLSRHLQLLVKEGRLSAHSRPRARRYQPRP